MNGSSSLKNHATNGVELPTAGSGPKEPPYPKLQKSQSWNINKLTPEFTNMEDEAVLGKMMGDEGEKLLALVDDIRQIDNLRGIELNMPQIVVVGDTSSGKSSVLQALTRLPFPVANGLCTRFVTETTIRRCPPFERPGYKIELKADHTNGLKISQTATFSPKAYDSDDWDEVYQHLKEDIAQAFDDMGPAKVPPRAVSSSSRADTHSTDSKSVPQLLKHRLEINVRKPNQAHFSIVDVPGFVSAGAEADVALSTELALGYIKNKEAIILAITPANVDFVNTKWWNLVEANNALDRTIGVLTKCDLIENRNEGNFFNFLQNNALSPHHLKLGWFAVRNRNPEEVFDEETFKKRDEKEKELFTTGKWKAASSDSSTRGPLDPNVLGTQSLKRKVQEHLYQRVKENFPNLKNEMKTLESKYEAKLRDMGVPRDNARDQRVYLSNIQTNYQAEVDRSLSGEYRSKDPNHPCRLRYLVKLFDEQFALDMRDKSIKYPWQLGDDDDEEAKKSQTGILHWIDKTWAAHIGSEPRHDAPKGLKRALVKQQTESWETRTEFYIQKVEQAIQECNNDIYQVTCENDGLRANIRERLEAVEAESFEAARAELHNILQDRNYLDSWNPLFDDLFADYQSSRVDRQIVPPRLWAKENTEGQNQDHEAHLKELAARKKFNSDNKRVYEVHDWLYAYWAVTYPRFVDNVIIQVVERHLLGRNGPLRLFSRDWVDKLEDDELDWLVGENEKTRDDRKELKQKLEGLKNALKKTENALRSRSH